MLQNSESPSKDFEKEICVFCEKRFLSKETLKQHILTDHKPNSYKCENDECEKMFKTKIRMLDHMDAVHMKRKFTSKYRRKTIVMRKCPFDVCGKVETTKVSLYSHILSNHRGADQNPSFKCKFCAEEFVDQYKLGGHRRRKHPKERELKAVEQYPCLFCDKMVNTKFSLNSHMSRKHSDIPEDQRLIPERGNSSQCKFCEKSFEGKFVLRAHTKREHPGKSRNWVSKMEELVQTIKTFNIPHSNENDNSDDNTDDPDDPAENPSVHTSVKDDSKADKESKENEKGCRNQDITNSKIELNDIVGECFVTDNFETSLEKESTKESKKGTITDGIEENYKEISTQQEIDATEEYGFPAYRRTTSEEISTRPDFRKEHLNEEKVVNARHVGEKRHMCERCPFSCDRPYILRDHILSKHEGQRIECNICNARFQRSKNLREHMRTKHAKEKIMCEICDFATNWRVALVKHQQTRHGIVKEKLPEALSCEKCDHVARTQGSLKEHILYKHGGTKHQCTKCPSSFVRERDQKRHIVSKHKLNKILKEESISPNSSPCDQCNHVARSGWCLREHIASRHEGIKHQCEKCETLFVRERDLKRHIVTKH